MCCGKTTPDDGAQAKGTGVVLTQRTMNKNQGDRRVGDHRVSEVWSLVWRLTTHGIHDPSTREIIS